MKSLGLFLLAATGAVAVLGALLAFVFRHPMERRALVISGLLAIAVQVVTFTAARFADRKHMMTVWGFGVLLRFVTLVVYALVMLEPLGLPAPAALLSLATFLFVTTLIEPRLLST